MESFKERRNFLKAVQWGELRKQKTDQQKRTPPPPLQKPHDEDAVLIDLIAPEDLNVGKMPLIDAIGRRRSRRKYTSASMTLEEVSFLLWATQGVDSVLPNNVGALRTVPSAGARHPFETYLFINQIDGLDVGLYRYLPFNHQMCFLYTDENLLKNVHDACYRQYVKTSSVVFIWTTIPYRTEWRYSLSSYKFIALDAGHLCQNLYLAAESLGAGMCAIGAYDQEKIDAVLKIDGEEEFVIYIATVGKIE